MLNETNTCIHIGISAEIVFLTVDSCVCTSIILGTIAISGTGCIYNPCTLSNTILIECILNTTNSFLTNVKFVIRTCVAVTITSSLPTGLKFAIDGVIEVTVHLEDTGAGGIYLAAAFILTYELSVNDLVVMSDLDLGNDSAPIYNRLAALAVSSVLIACLCSGCFLVKGYKLCVVKVIRRRNSCKFGCYIDRAAEEVTIYSTADNVTYDVDNRTVIAGNILTCFISIACGIIIFFVNIIVQVIGPYANRNAYESVIKSLATCAVSFNGHGKNLRNLVILKGSLEAICNNCTLGFPSVRVVKLELCNELVYVCKICYIDVYIVDRLSLRSIVGIVMTAKLNYSITRNCKCTCDLHGVTKLVLNLKGNSVNACAKSNVALGGKHIAVDRGFYNNAVNGNLTGGKVERGIISNSCGERNVVTIDNLAVIKRNSNVRCRVSGSGDSGKHSIVNSRAVVESDIVNVECNYICSIGFYISTNERGGTRIGFVSWRHSRHIVVLADVDGSINPSRFGNVCIRCRVKVCLLAGSGRSEHKVLLLTRCFSVNRPVCIDIELRLERKTLACRGECIFGNIKPHAKSSSLHSVCNVTENDYVVGVEKHIIRPIRKIGVGIIKSPCKSIVTISNLATVGCGSNECSTAQLVIKLTCKRGGTNE